MIDLRRAGACIEAVTFSSGNAWILQDSSKDRKSMEPVMTMVPSVAVVSVQFFDAVIRIRV